MVLVRKFVIGYTSIDEYLLDITLYSNPWDTTNIINKLRLQL